ncbi:hypothetical protein FE257_007463 [Aspergillus nanangensis]|uniref:RTA1 domain protein n=1 Tax=Aspergillus nanangensis TaxID=2582783 RepID=A0AAD4CPC4_ASPNN|nr:hypothetical protein FE257_007463 [Aspergillus nanangensis]
MSDSSNENLHLFLYDPNIPAAIVCCAAFGISASLHLWACRYYKCFKLMWLHIFCTLMFTAGFALRAYLSFHHDWNQLNLNLYIASTSLIYMAPPLLELANYHILGRVLYYVPYFSPIHPGRSLTTFGFLSAIVEALNAIGVSYTANRSLPEDRIKLGHILMKASLICQIAIIALFCVFAIIFHRRCATGGIISRRVSTPLFALYASSVLILARCIYRIVEHFTISSLESDPNADISPLLRHEWYFYVFEAAFMLVNSFLWNWKHPRRYLPESSKTYLAQDGITEVEGPGWKDNRPFVATLLDPFGWFDSKGKHETPFWEKNGYMSVQNTAGDDPEQVPLR